MLIAGFITFLLGAFIALIGAVYCSKPDMIVRQNETTQRPPVLLHFALPITRRDARLTARQVRNTGLGLLLLGAWFLIVGITAL